MTDEDLNKLRRVVREELVDALGSVSAGFNSVNERLDSVDKKLDVVWDQVAKLTVEVSDVQETLKSHCLTYFQHRLLA